MNELFKTLTDAAQPSTADYLTEWLSLCAWPAACAIVGWSVFSWLRVRKTGKGSP